MKKLFLLCAVCLSAFAAISQVNRATDLYYTGVALSENNNYQLAILSFDSALVLNPGYNDALHYRGIARYNMGMYEDAIMDFQGVISKDPHYYAAYVNMANAYLRMNNYIKVVDVLANAASIDPSATDAYNIMGNLNFAQGKYDDAKGYYQSLLLFDLKNDAASFNLGNTYYRLGMFDSAAYYHQMALKLQPNIPDYMFPLALDYGSQENPKLLQQSMDISQQILAINPNYPQANAQVAYLLMKNPAYDPKLVLSYLNKAIVPQTGSNWYAYAMRANMYAKMGMYDSALADYNRGITDFPGNVYAYSGRAALYRDSGMYREAVKDYSKAIYLQPSAAAPYLALGDLMMRMGYYHSADSFLNFYFQYSSDKKTAQAEIHNARAAGFLNTRQYEKAHSEASLALSLQPGSASALNNRGMALARLGKLDSALYYLNRSLEIDKFNPSFWHNRAYALARRGDIQPACKDLQQALLLHYNLRPDSLLIRLIPVCNLSITPPVLREVPSLTAIMNVISENASGMAQYSSFLQQRNPFFNIENKYRNSYYNSNNYSILLYPNPARDRVNVAPNQFPSDPFAIMMFDPSGRIVRSNLNLEQTDSGISFDINDLRDGRYVVMLVSRNTLLAKSILWVSH